jgi:two-component system NtrC family sensor kinase
MRRRGWGLASKLALSLATGLVVTFVALGLYHLHSERYHLTSFQVLNASRISEIIRRSGRDYMLHNDSDGLFRMIRRVGQQPGIVKIRIFNKEGIISYSTDSTEVSHKVDKAAEACAGCHGRGQTLSHPPSGSRVRILRGPAGERVLALIDPIRNEPECATAPCHAHPPDREILGVLDTHISLAEADFRLAQLRRETILWLLGTLIVVLLISVGFVHVFVFRPVSQLHEATRRISRGDLDHPIPVHSRDELGALASAFRDMMGQLKRAREELTRWSQTLEEKVREKTEELEAVHRHVLQMERMASVGKLAAIVAHEINNPLAGIRTYAALLKKQASGDGRQAEILGLIENEAARCGEIVKNLLQYLRPGSLEAKLHDLQELIRRVVRLVQHQVDLQQVHLQVELDPELGPIECDGQQIQQCLLAVLINALEAVGEGGEIAIRARRLAPSAEEPGEGVEIQIEDNGVGMDAETLERIFEPFFSTKEGSSAMGLGMSVVYGIVTRHGGRIHVDSAPGRGTTVTIRLPTRQAARGVTSDGDESVRVEA